jgi:colanic acid/amylovoran biosynthesis glycosyltransferase
VPVVAVYRSSLLAPSETFIRNEALALRRYVPIFVGEQRQNGLDLPDDRVFVGTPGRRLRRAMLRRLPTHDPFRRIVRACRAHHVDLVHAHFGPDGVQGLELARRVGVPLVVTFWGFDATIADEAMLAEGGALATYVRRRPELFDEAALLIGVSRFIRDELRRQGAPEEKLRVHHTGHPRATGPEPGRRELTVLFIGRHVEKKGLGDLIMAMASVRATVPRARLVVIGDGPLRRGYEELARDRLQGAAEFVGWLTADDVSQRLRRASVLCVPSRRAANGDAEGLPTVIPEALAHGVPVVGTRHSGIPEAIGWDGGGLLADEGDIDGIARQLTAVLTDGDLWQRLSAAAHQNVERNFDVDRQVEEIERLYDEALDRGAR